MWIIITRPSDMFDYERDWARELKQLQQDEKAHWIIMITQLVSQVKSKVLSYINLIRKSREKDYHDEHETMFELT